MADGAKAAVAAALSKDSPRTGAASDAAPGATSDGGDARRIELATVDSGCSAEGGKAAAQTFVALGATVVVGFLCADSIEAALPILKHASIPLIDVGVRAARLTDRRDRTGNLVWRLAPRSDAEALAIASLVADRWRAEAFGLIDDGSIAARGLSDTVRRLLADRGLQPQAIDNYRPAEEKQFGLVRRLARTAVSRYFIAGDRPDIATIVRDAAAIGLTLDIVGGESLIDEAGDVTLAEGAVAVGPKTRFPALEAPRTPGAPPTSAPAAVPPTALEQDASGPQGYFGTAYAATEIAIAASHFPRAGGVARPSTPEAASNAAAIVKALDERTFQTGLGPIRFDARGDSDLDLMRVYRWNGERFVPEAGG